MTAHVESDRRRFLRLGAGLGLAAGAGPVVSILGCGGSSPTEPGEPPRAGNPLPRPPELSGELVAQSATGTVWPGTTTALWTLGGVYPSPTLRLTAGQGFGIRLRNDLAESTNVHWHGLVVPEAADGHPSDLVAPGASRDVAFTAPPRAGTFWYHPHPDRRTAPQVYAGMAGFLVVEDGVDAAVGLPTGERDVPVLLQDRRLFDDRSFTYAPFPMDLMSGYLGDVALANGTPDAYLSVSASPWRLRLLNGSNARVFRVGFEDGRTFHVVGSDGGLLERPVAASVLDLGPGERVEIVADFSGDSVGGSVHLVSHTFTVPGGGFGPGMGPGMGMGGGAPQGSPMTLLRLDVDRPSEAPPFQPPEALVPIERHDPARVRTRRSFVMQTWMPPVHGAFTINGLAFEPGRVDVRVPRGELELWDVVNASAHPHPFHVHAVQFQVASRTSGPVGPHETGWKDTVLVWPGERMELLMRFEGDAGLFILHCHNLEHEDAGMMLNMEVL
jgi:FtsP/CotA-like multicopper oxidase with cupredoxin domain